MTTDSVTLYRLWREAADAGLRITPAYVRGPATGQTEDHIYLVNRPGEDETHPRVITDLESFFGEWLARLYADPAARAQAAERELASYPGEAR